MTIDSPPAGRPWYRDRGLAIIWVSGGLLTLVVGAGLLPRPALGAVTWLAMAAMEATQAALCWMIGNTPAVKRSVRRFWRAAALAPVLFAAGSLTQTVLAVHDPYARTVFTGTPLQAALATTGAAILVTALLSAPVELFTHRAR